MKILFVWTGPTDYLIIDSPNKNFVNKLRANILSNSKPLTFPILAALTPEKHSIEVVECDHHVIFYFSREDFNRRMAIMGKDFEYKDTTDYSGWMRLEECLRHKFDMIPKRIQDDMDKYPCSSIKKGHRKVWCWYFDYCWEICKNL